MQPWTLHDLRRTAASGMARLGVNIATVEKILNHTSGTFAGVTGIYQRHDFATEKRLALASWAAHVLAVAAGEELPGNVVALREVI
jgi:integrase